MAIMDNQNTDRKAALRMPEMLTVSASPHIKSSDNVRNVMLTVIIAMLPALLWSVYLYGIRALLVVAVATASSVGAEFLYQKLMKQKITVGDLSAVVTGMLLGFNLSPLVPLWMAAVGSIFAIVIVKQLFGGIGKNFLNPALAARVFLFIAFSKPMATFAQPFAKLSIFGDNVDAVASATPLASLKAGTIPSDINVFQAFIGQTGGCIGELSCLLLLCGGIVMLARKVITWHIPVSFIGSVALLTYLFAPQTTDAVSFMFYSIFSGGVFLGAIFMATDYATCPMTSTGKLIYGVGCGAITVFIRFFAGFNEGVSFAILVMNLLVWYIDKLTRPRPFGKIKEKKNKGEGKEQAAK